jgi:hypothetical protein
LLTADADNDDYPPGPTGPPPHFLRPTA